MTDHTIATDRLRLTPLDAQGIDALIAGDAERLRSLTGSRLSYAAAPPYMAEALPDVRERLRLHPEEAAWWNWLIVREDTGEAIGAVALGGPPDSSGAVLVGYAVYPEHEGFGFATEAVRAMVAWAFRQPGVREVRALAPVWNTPALRVAENVGMRPVAS
ncbi:MAG TPA: GNAT family N-acetyltransferase, partial [Gemmatimonadales bacterium]|nr:GNAT family N-acetyltransferase [Gemmatimonadales bacterium]